MVHSAIIINITIAESTMETTTNAKSTNIIRAKGWFLTWPKCPLEKEYVLALLEQTGPIVEHVICEEKHEDGSPHVHAFVKYNKRVVWNATKWDLNEYHGHYEVAKSWNAVSKYCKKDGNYLASIDVESASKKKAKNNKELLAMCPREAVEEGHCTVYQLRALIQAQSLYRDLCARDLPTCEDSIPNPWAVNLPLLKDKQKHYWFWSDRPNRWKTSFLKDLDLKFRCSWFNTAEVYQ